MDEVGRFEKSKEAAVEDARDVTDEFVTYIDDLFDEQKKLLDQFRDPYSDELVETNKRRVWDEIMGVTGDLLSRSGTELGKRGIRGGGPVSSAVASIQGNALEARAGSFTDILNEQQRINTQTNLSLASLGTGLTSNQARLATTLGLAESQYAVSNMTADPRIFIDVLSGITGAQFSLDQQDEMLEAIADMEPGEFEKIASGLGNWFMSQGISQGNPVFTGIGNMIPILGGTIGNLLEDWGWG